MNASQIKSAIDCGCRVVVADTDENYEVIKDSCGQYLIWSKFNDNYIGLTHMDGETLNMSDFIVIED